jgi:hypothetical protein
MRIHNIGNKKGFLPQNDSVIPVGKDQEKEEILPIGKKITYFNFAFAPRISILFCPMPVVHVRRVGSFLH